MAADLVTLDAPAPAPSPGALALVAPPCDAPAEALRSPSWPRGRLAGLTLHLLLAATALAPVWPATGTGHGRALLAAALASIAGRLGLEALGPAPRQSALVRWSGAAAAAAVSTAVLAVAALVLGLALAVPLVPVTAGLSATLLLLGLNARGLELAYGARLRRVVLLGSPAQHAELLRETARTGDIELVGSHGPGALRTLSPEGLVERVLAARPTMLVLGEEAMRDPQLVAVAAALNLRGVRVRPLRDLYEGTFGKVAVSELSPAWFLFDIAEIHRARLYGSLKRAVEIVAGLGGLVATAPLLPLIALGIKLASPDGPLLFRQDRVGLHGQVFSLTKFRTMHPDRTLETGTWAAASDGRIFTFGSLLRKFRLDELPQLWNIVRGDLSLVGPRPEQPSITRRLGEQMPYYAARHAVRPGLTGWAQVNFGYGGTDEAARTKLQYDLFYVKRQSLRLDVRIVFATVRTVLLGAGR